MHTSRLIHIDIVLVPYNTGTMNNKYGLDVDEIIRMNANGYLLKDIALHYGCKYQILQSWLAVRNIKLISNPINKAVDHSFFDNIDSELKAYLLGFFAADGCVYDANRIGICLAEKDKEIVELFRNSISPKSKIKVSINTKGAANRQPQHIIRINSCRIVKSLSKYGIGPRKTFSNMTVPNISVNLIPHYVRGYFDGDGSVGLKTMRSGNKYLRVHIANGSREILDSMLAILSNWNIRGSITEVRSNCYCLNIYNATSTQLFYKYIYSGSEFYLNRKREIFKSYYENTELINRSKKLLTV